MSSELRQDRSRALMAGAWNPDARSPARETIAAGLEGAPSSAGHAGGCASVGARFLNPTSQRRRLSDDRS